VTFVRLITVREPYSWDVSEIGVNDVSTSYCRSSS